LNPIAEKAIARLFVTALIFVLCVSCAGPGVRTNLSMNTGIRGAAPDSNEDVDTACSYFYFLVARDAELNGRDAEAQEAYEKAIVCDGGAVYIVRRLAALLLKMGKREAAIRWMRKLIAARPDDIGTKIFLAELYTSIAENKKAVDIYEHILKLAPKNNAVMLCLGKLYLHNLEYSKSRRILERLVGENPDSFSGWYYLAHLYRELNYTDKAAHAYERALGISWSVPLAMETATFYEGQKEDNKAVVIYKKILAADEGDEGAAGQLVRIYLQNNEVDEALSLLRGLRAKTADSQKIDFTIGRIYLDQQEYGKAIALFRDMRFRNPADGKIRLLLALSYYKSGAKEQARDLLLQIPPGADGYDAAVLLLVKFYVVEKDYPAAAGLLREAIAGTKGEEQLNFYFGLAALYEENKQADKAAAVFQAAISQFNSAKTHLRYGMFLDRTGCQDTALVQMKKALKLEPDNIVALNYIGYTWADRGVKLTKALQYIKKAVVGRPDDGFIRDSLGWVYFKLGKTKRAVAELKKALRAEADDPTIHEHLGDVYSARSEMKPALANYRKSLRLFEKNVDRRRLRAKIQALQKRQHTESGIWDDD